MSRYNDEEVIAALLIFINQYTGLDLRADGYFKGIKDHKGKKYFNVELQQKTSGSIEYNQLERLIALSYGTITNVEPNGVRRAAVFFDANKLHLLPCPSHGEPRIPNKTKKATVGKTAAF